MNCGTGTGLPVDGAQINVPHMHFFHYDAEFRLTDLWHVWNTLMLARQLGAPAPDLKGRCACVRSRRAAALAPGNDRSRLDSTAVKRDRCHRDAWRVPGSWSS